MMALAASGATQQVCTQPVLIETPCSDKRVHAALTGASAHPRQRLYRGTITALPPAALPAGSKRVPQPPDLVGN